MEFDGQTAIVTGAGSGYGRAITLRLARGGARVVAADINLAAVEETATLVKKDKGKALAVQTDVSSAVSVEAMVKAAQVQYGDHVDIVVNNAGLWQLGNTDELSESDWDKVVNVNMKGVFLCCRAVVPIMKKFRRGHIVNIASVAARTGGSYAGLHYVASKGAVLAMTKRMARELGPFGIVVNGVNPGSARTGLMAGWPETIVDGIVKSTPLGRLAEPKDIAEAVAFLASDAARFIHGETIEVNGGIVCD